MDLEKALLEEYFFYEWLILCKCMTSLEELESLTSDEFECLELEFNEFKNSRGLKND